MSSVRALPPVPYDLPNAANVPRANNSPLSMAAGLEFQTLLKAQLKLSFSSPDPTNTLTQAEQATYVSHELNIEAMLQHLDACRKMLFYASSKPSRPAPGILASPVATSDCRFADDSLVESTALIDPICVGDHSSVSCTEHIQDPTALRSNVCRNKLVYGVPIECAPQASTTAVTLPANIIIWIPVEIVRTPMQPVGARPRRRRKPRLAEIALSAWPWPQARRENPVP